MALCFKPLRLLAPCRPLIKRNLYILGNPDFDESKIKNIAEVIDDLSSGVIGGKFSIHTACPRSKVSKVNGYILETKQF